MKRPLKVVFGVAIGALLLVVLAVVAGLVMIDSIAERGVETGASHALGVSTEVESIDVGVLSREFSLNGLRVDNPEGFSGDFLTLRDGGVAVSLDSLLQDTVVLPRLALNGLRVDLSRNAHGSNYQVILDNLKRLESGQKPAPDPSRKKFVIREVTINDIVVDIDLVGAPGDFTRLQVPIHEIRLTDVGTDGAGVDLPELTAVLVEAVLAAVAAKGEGILPAEVMGELRSGLAPLRGLTQIGVETIGKLGEQASRLRTDVPAAIKDIENTAKDAAKRLEELRDLIPSQKDRTPEKK